MQVAIIDIFPTLLTWDSAKATANFVPQLNALKNQISDSIKRYKNKTFYVKLKFPPPYLMDLMTTQIFQVNKLFCQYKDTKTRILI